MFIISYPFTAVQYSLEPFKKKMSETWFLGKLSTNGLTFSKLKSGKIITPKGCLNISSNVTERTLFLKNETLRNEKKSIYENV